MHLSRKELNLNMPCRKTIPLKNSSESCRRVVADNIFWANSNETEMGVRMMYMVVNMRKKTQRQIESKDLSEWGDAKKITKHSIKARKFWSFKGIVAQVKEARDLLNRMTNTTENITFP